MRKEGKSPTIIDSALMPRIIQSCENEVLGIVHRIFNQYKWIVRAKVFDGLIVEPDPVKCLNIFQVMNEAENACRTFGWDIQLVEKSLFGKAEVPITIEKARSLIRNLSVGGHTYCVGSTYRAIY